LKQKRKGIDDKKYIGRWSSVLGSEQLYELTILKSKLLLYSNRANAKQEKKYKQLTSSPT